MKTFLLIALLNGQAYGLDSRLSADDCIGAIQQGVEHIQISETETVPAKGAILACQAEQPE